MAFQDVFNDALDEAVNRGTIDDFDDIERAAFEDAFDAFMVDDDGNERDHFPSIDEMNDEDRRAAIDFLNEYDLWDEFRDDFEGDRYEEKAA